MNVGGITRQLRGRSLKKGLGTKLISDMNSVPLRHLSLCKNSCECESRLEVQKRPTKST